ncbi:MAG: DUF3301 domain-containing protein [Gammaproteobacteria bacterium]
MSMLSHVSMIFLLLLAAVYWFKTQAVKERALAAVIKHCQDREVQMLDDYVALNYVGFKRDESGTIRIARTFSFEFSSSGAERYQGQITLLGRKVVAIQMEPYRIV